MEYVEPIYRPPSERNSLLLQVALGCSWPKCTFCASYLINFIKPFKIRAIDDIKRDIDLSKTIYNARSIRRVFLLDSNALAIKTDTLLEILNYITKSYPRIERISTYGTIKDIQRKSDSDLIKLKEAGLKMVYVGIESGDDIVLKEVNKGVNASEIISESKKLINNGIELSATIILGLGGQENSYNHIMNTANVINKINPHYLGALTLMVVPNTPLHQKIVKKEFVPLNPIQMIQELRLLVDNLTDLNNCVFRSNHASNYLAVKGILSKDRLLMLKTIDNCIKTQNLRPEYLRGL